MQSVSNVIIQRAFHKILNANENRLSIELCPKRDLDFELLKSISPRFCSVNWRVKSEQDYLENIENSDSLLLADQLCQKGYEVVLHVPGKHFSKRQVLRILQTAKSIGVKGIFAIQGDLPYQQAKTRCDFEYASDLVAFIKCHFSDTFLIGIAGYPERHPDTASIQEDILNMKRKISAGGDFIISQGCFTCDHYSQFVRICRSNGITIPIFTGIFPNAMFSMNRLRGVTYPRELVDTETTKFKIGEKLLNHAKNIVTDLLKDEMINGIHIFSMNNMNFCKEIFNECNITVPKLV